MSVSIKKLFLNKKVVAIGAAAILTVGIAGGAFAFFTSTGSGTGTGTVGTSTAWSVNGGSVVGTLFPDASAATGANQGVITGASVTNAATSGNQELNKIVATISGVTTSAAFPSEAACATTDFQFNSPTTTWTGTGTQTATILPAQDLAAGGSYTISDLNVVLVDNSTAQDNCQGQTVTVTFSAS
jgi:hypothetical protein